MTSKPIRETITFSCEPEFKSLISTKVTELGYQNKSQMIRDALQIFFESEDSLDRISSKEKTKITALVSVVYNHHDLNTLQKFMQIQHQTDVAFSSHFHMNHECLENFTIKDDAKTVRSFLQKLRAISGLKYISFRIISRNLSGSES
ncbi:MAG: CopG family ribbon-helix-helix protein [Candidatus Hermodarchaeota archaeon]